MKGALFASKFSALSHVKLVDFTASTESMAYLIAEMERLSATRYLTSSGSSDDLLSTSCFARSRASSSSWSNVTYRPLRADILCPSRVSNPIGKWRKFMACFLYPRTHIATLTWSCARDCSTPITLITRSAFSNLYKLYAMSLVGYRVVPSERVSVNEVTSNDFDKPSFSRSA